MRPDSRPRAGARSGFTIVELLIAATISLILTYAVIQMFDYVASEARYGRASIELAGQLRSASRRLSTDLGCATANVLPYADRHGQGYLEYMEGPGTDSIAMVATNLGTYYGPPYTPTVRTSGIDATASTIAVETSVGGDVDDILMFTAYNPDEPFRGRFVYWDAVAMVEVTTIVESKYAEIVIWTARDPENGRVNLYRRALLIRPDLTPLDRYTDITPLIDPTSTSPTEQAELKRRFQAYYQENDISIRYEVTRSPPPTVAVTDARFVGNTLADLSRRENRFAHINYFDPSFAGGPHLFPIDAEQLQIQDWLSTWTSPGWMLAGDLEGNDVLLSEVLAFDVKAYDPLANMQLDADSFGLNPSDQGYSTATSTTLPTALGRTGAFVDLGYDVTQGYNYADGSGTWFSGNPHPKSRLLNVRFSGGTAAPPQDRFTYRTYCTWSQYYESNGFNENGAPYTAYPAYGTYADAVTDGGTNGLDDDGDGAVDEVERNDWWQAPPAPPAQNRYIGEGDTSPPYPKPLRGLQITLRVMEPNSRQVRQMTVVQNFIGE